MLFSPNMKHVERRLKIIAIPRLSDMVSMIKWARIGYKFAFSLPIKYTRDQREWVFEVREVKSEMKKLSLFFEKCKVKKNAITLF